MNRRLAVVGAVAAALALTAAAGAFGAVGLSPGDDGPADTGPADPGTPTDTPQTIAHDGDALTLENDPDQVVEGATSLDAGAEVTVRLRSTGSSQPFIKQTTVTVGEDGRYETTFEMNGVDSGTQFRATVVHDGEELANVTGEVVEGSVPETAEADNGSNVFEFDGDALTLQSAPDQVVVGTTDLDAGTEVTVRLRSTGSSQPFIKQTTVTVGDDGRFEATFDMSEIEAGASFNVTVRADGETVDETPGEVVTDES